MPQPAPTEAHVAGGQAHLLGVPPPPQVVPDWLQVPQSIMCPHPSETMPQPAPSSGQVDGVQPHIFDSPPPPHVSGAVHEPHWTVDPQPSETTPQFAPRS
jgi:hypothetical protein